MATAPPAERALFPWEVRALRTAHRRVPLGEGGGYCRWCSKALIATRGKLKGRIDPARSWCREPGGGSPCLRELNLHRDSAMQFAWLAEHRGERCAWCRAEKPMIWRRMSSMPSRVLNWSNGGLDRDWLAELWPQLPDPAWSEAEHKMHGLQSQIELVSALAVDHTMPLWLVALIIPEAERRPYFGPDNLQLLCTGCHKIKTAREAAERAAIKAFARAQLGFDFA